MRRETGNPIAYTLIPATFAFRFITKSVRLIVIRIVYNKNIKLFAKAIEMNDIIALIFIVIGTCLFMQGFFLSRKSIIKYSFSNETISLHNFQTKTNNHTTNNNKPIIFKHVILLIIDALRIDFMIKSTEETNTNQPYIPIINDLLITNTSQTHLFTFKADPPTFTTARLKGITTGSLPSFLDILSNIDSAAIEEDNFIYQLNRHNKRYVPTSCL